MKIEIAEPGRMTQSGSSLLKLIQNNNMPILDLLVRESIQNSLDAKNEKDLYVTVEFFTGDFNKLSLNSELEGITDSLNRKYWKNEYKYIAVRDSNTVGLTGKLHYDEVTDNQYGNLLKLIYEISKPQEAEGAGGSWGLGKTVYFRVGIGLVIYYSRIVNEQGQYESRLAASLVEDEMEKDSLIPALPGKSKRGIAWWGQEIGDNKTKPITDDQYIGRILKIFGMDPYDGDLTGTTIIIPYIDEQMLLENNQIEYKDSEDNSIRPFWRCSVEDYLRVAIQRWYAPRLNNTKYPYGKFLRARVNKIGIGLDSMEPAFQIVQALYNRAISEGVCDDILKDDGVECKVEEIILRKVLETTKAGTVAYAKVQRKILKTGYPNNKPEPYMYFNCEIRDKEKNKPVLFFTRKPGMIVSYEDVGNWVDGISASNKDEFIFAIFVLNSENKLANTNEIYSLEEYVRKSEMADHTSWGDFSMGTNNPRIVSKVQDQVNKKISKEFSVEEEDTTSRLNSGLGKMFGDLLLPPENFGKKPSSGSGGGQGGNGHIETHKNVIFGYDPSKTKYSSNVMAVKLTIKSRRKIASTGINLAIDSETGAIKPKDWEEKMGLSMPFAIVSTDIAITKIDGSCSNLKMIVDSTNVKTKMDDISCELIKTNKNSGCGIRIISENEHQMEIELDVSLQLNRKDIKPLFNVEKNEGDK
ncbi:MAG: hypothetical protein J1D87_01900 [Lachnospiraceae bacterium]|nr:hypothetical protein [Lachnospiraceae bacterium]